jgi:peroxiredoxin Q/BCP
MENKKAPEFSINNQHGTTISLDQFIGKKVLIYFYPKDMTPGCSIEAQGFQDLYKEFQDNNIEIIAVSKDSEESHQKFCDAFGLEFNLLADTKTTMVQDYEVWKEKSMFGKKYMGISRESFLVDETGIIIKHWDKVTPVSHPKEVLTFVKNSS